MIIYRYRKNAGLPDASRHTISFKPGADIKSLEDKSGVFSICEFFVDEMVRANCLPLSVWDAGRMDDLVFTLATGSDLNEFDEAFA